MRFAGLFFLAGLAFAQGPGYEPVANTGQLMQGMIDPASKAIAEAAKEAGPADNRAWRGAMLNGLMLQEAAQMLKVSARAKDPDGWMKAAAAMGEAGAAVQKAATAKDLAAFQTAAGAISGTCQGCHSVYRQRGGGKKQ